PGWRARSRSSRRPATALQPDRSRRLILIGLAAAALATALLMVLAPRLGAPDASSSTGLIDVDQPAPAITGTTLDGVPFDLASLRGRPVIVNFWGPTCEPCRDEFPLFTAKLAEHAADGVTIVGVRM